jgi:hypothetical protein
MSFRNISLTLQFANIWITVSFLAKKSHKRRRTYGFLLFHKELRSTAFIFLRRKINAIITTASGSLSSNKTKTNLVETLLREQLGQKAQDILTSIVEFCKQVKLMMSSLKLIILMRRCLNTNTI